MKTRSQSEIVGGSRVKKHGKPAAVRRSTTSASRPAGRNPLGLPQYDEELSEGEEELVKALDEFDEGNEEGEVEGDTVSDGINHDDDEEAPEDISFTHSKQTVLQDKQLVRQQLILDKEKKKQVAREKVERLRREKEACRGGAVMTDAVDSSKYLSMDVLEAISSRGALAGGAETAARGDSPATADTSYTTTTTVPDDSTTSASTTTEEDNMMATTHHRYKVVNMSDGDSLLPLTSMEQAKQFKHKMMSRVKRQSSKALLRQRDKRIKCGLGVAKIS